MAGLEELQSSRGGRLMRSVPQDSCFLPEGISLSAGLESRAELEKRSLPRLRRYGAGIWVTTVTGTWEAKSWREVLQRKNIIICVQIPFKSLTNSEVYMCGERLGEPRRIEQLGGYRTAGLSSHTMLESQRLESRPYLSGWILVSPLGIQLRPWKWSNG